MVNSDYNLSTLQAQTYKGFLQIEIGTDLHRLKELQSVSVNFNDSNLERHFSDDGASVFVKVGDVVGTFSFESTMTTDLAGSETDDKTASAWIKQLNNGTPAEITFIQTFTSESDDARLKFKGRIMSVNTNRSEGAGANSIAISGELTFFEFLT